MHNYTLFQVYPQGIFFLITLVVSFHLIFLTRVDRAFSLNFHYGPALPFSVNAQLYSVPGVPTRNILLNYPGRQFPSNISDKSGQNLQSELPLSTRSTIQCQCTIILCSSGIGLHGSLAGSGYGREPKCSYTIRAYSLNGPPARFARVGDKVYHVWKCENEENIIIIHDCYVSDVGGKQTVKVIDANGCSLDPVLISDIMYGDTRYPLAIAESHVFKYADKTSVFFSCAIRMCDYFDPTCHAPKCPHANSYGYGNHVSVASSPAPPYGLTSRGKAPYRSGVSDADEKSIVEHVVPLKQSVNHVETAKDLILNRIKLWRLRNITAPHDGRRVLRILGLNEMLKALETTTAGPATEKLLLENLELETSTEELVKETANHQTEENIEKQGEETTHQKDDIATDKPESKDISNLEHSVTQRTLRVFGNEVKLNENFLVHNAREAIARLLQRPLRGNDTILTEMQESHRLPLSFSVRRQNSATSPVDHTFPLDLLHVAERLAFDPSTDPSFKPELFLTRAPIKRPVKRKPRRRYSTTRYKLTGKQEKLSSKVEIDIEKNVVNTVEKNKSTPRSDISASETMISSPTEQVEAKPNPTHVSKTLVGNVSQHPTRKRQLTTESTTQTNEHTDRQTVKRKITIPPGMMADHVALPAREMDVISNTVAIADVGDEDLGYELRQAPILSPTFEQPTSTNNSSTFRYCLTTRWFSLLVSLLAAFAVISLSFFVSACLKKIGPIPVTRSRPSDYGFNPKLHRIMPYLKENIPSIRRHPLSFSRARQARQEHSSRFFNLENSPNLCVNRLPKQDAAVEHFPKKLAKHEAAENHYDSAACYSLVTTIERPTSSAKNNLQSSREHSVAGEIITERF